MVDKLLSLVTEGVEVEGHNMSSFKAVTSDSSFTMSRNQNDSGKSVGKIIGLVEW